MIEKKSNNISVDNEVAAEMSNNGTIETTQDEETYADTTKGDGDEEFIMEASVIKLETTATDIASRITSYSSSSKKSEFDKTTVKTIVSNAAYKKESNNKEGKIDETSRSSNKEDPKSKGNSMMIDFGIQKVLADTKTTPIQYTESIAVKSETILLMTEISTADMENSFHHDKLERGKIEGALFSKNIMSTIDENKANDDVNDKHMRYSAGIHKQPSKETNELSSGDMITAKSRYKTSIPSYKNSSKKQTFKNNIYYGTTEEAIQKTPDSRHDIEMYNNNAASKTKAKTDYSLGQESIEISTDKDDKVLKNKYDNSNIDTDNLPQSSSSSTNQQQQQTQPGAQHMSSSFNNVPDDDYHNSSNNNNNNCDDTTIQTFDMESTLVGGSYHSRESNDVLPIANLIEEDSDDDESMAVASEFYYKNKNNRSSQSKLRRVVLCTLLVILGIVGVVLAALINAKRANNGEDEGSGLLGNVVVSATMEPTTYRENIGIQQVIDALFIDDDANKTATNKLYQQPGTAEYKAMDWIINKDPEELSASKTHRLHQRYLMAYLYYQTSQKEPWYSCNPPTGKKRDTCTFKELWKGVFRDRRASRWLSANHECDWGGVTCGKPGVVTEIYLDGHLLSGPFPTEIIKLSTLRRIHLGHNQMTGHLPVDIGNIMHFYVNSNYFTGTIPSQWFDNLNGSNLTTINIHGNALTGAFPTEISQLSNLSTGYFGNNLLSGTLPKEIFQLPLNTLKMQSTYIEGSIPSEIGLPSDTLINLDLSKSKIIGTIPTEIGKLSKLHDLIIYKTQVSGHLPEELYNCREALFIKLSNNNLSGTISPKISQLKRLFIFKIAHNAFTGRLPTEMGLVNSIHSISLQDNLFSGDIPSELCAIKGPTVILDLKSDCSPLDSTGFPAMECPITCCTECCNRETGVCYEN